MAEKKTRNAELETAESTDTSASAAPAEGSKEWWDEPVTVQLFKDDGNYKDDVFVSVNGKTWQIKRGYKVQVPRFVAEVLNQSMEQDMQTATMITEKEQAYTDAEKKILS